MSPGRGHEIRSPFFTRIVCPDPVSDRFFFFFTDPFSGPASKKLCYHSSLLRLECQQKRFLKIRFEFASSLFFSYSFTGRPSVI